MAEQVIELANLAEQISGCPKCALAKTRTNAVPGSGNPNADIVFIGEGPGFHEDQQGLPFVGAAGKFLDELLASINLRREDVYICNVIKCRAPDNRDPLPNEIDACTPWLTQQLDVLKPRMIVTLGRFSMSRYFPGATIGRIHGQAKRIDGVLVVPMYHPAAALHQASLRQTIMEDFQKLPGLLELAAAEEAQPREPQPTQLQLL
ncbi:MAG: uracil-DNA glycosylase [Chloroflexi bacterium]|nr:uracil-DNA glycosylase [Chloroflexota bacterium]